MSNISSVTLNTVVYDIGDAYAREEIDNINDLLNITEKTSSNIVDPDGLSVGWYIAKSTGDLTEMPSTSVYHDDWAVSDYIPVSESNISSINCIGSTSSVAYSYNVYDENKNKLRSVASQSYSYQSGDYYIRFCFNFNGWEEPIIAMANYGDVALAVEEYGNTTADSHLITQLIEHSDEIIEKLDYEEPRYLEALIDKMLMVGDSTCEGLVSDYPYLRNRNPRWSSSAYLSKMTGWEIQNDGHYSWNAVDWLNNSYQTGTYDDFQLATIEFGYNSTINNTISTDVSPYDDWENYANTQCGNYCKVIGALQEENPNLIIMPVIQANVSSTTASTIKAISEYFGLTYIDLSVTDLNDRKYHGYYSEANMNNDVVDYTHFNILGYSRKAQVMRKQILEYFAQNETAVEQTISRQQAIQYPDQPSN